jgi:hypothetical protein
MTERAAAGMLQALQPPDQSAGVGGIGLDRARAAGQGCPRPQPGRHWRCPAGSVGSHTGTGWKVGATPARQTLQCRHLLEGLWQTQGQRCYHWRGGWPGLKTLAWRLQSRRRLLQPLAAARVCYVAGAVAAGAQTLSNRQLAAASMVWRLCQAPCQLPRHGARPYQQPQSCRPVAAPAQACRPPWHPPPALPPRSCSQPPSFRRRPQPGRPWPPPPRPRPLWRC